MSQPLTELLEKTKDLEILYVEDNEEVRQSTLDLLGIFFEHIDVASNGEEGLKLYRNHYEAYGKYHDIVFTDINMPKIDGIEMIRQIKKIFDRQNIIVISAHNESDHLVKLIDLEVNNFILKPVMLEQFQRVVSNIVDIILHKRAFKAVNEQLKKAKQAAEEATRQKSIFLANMSHEIRTPLNAITGFLSLLEEKETDTTKLKYLQVIKNSSDSLLQIINDILDISKIESGKMQIQPVNFNPYESLITIAELFQSKAAEKHIDFKIQYNHNMPSLLYGDVLRIKQIFTNLLSNAIKFTPDGGMVRSVIWYKDGYLNIAVKDHGIGISEEKQKKIFKPFTQADESTERVFGGTGLGLTISLELTHMLGGELILKSEEGKGSLFRLCVPLDIGENEKAQEKDDPFSPGKGHILIVEDHEASRMFLGIILENAGFTYDLAEDGIKAIEKFETGSYDLILMDENMPKMGGIEASRKIRKIEHDRDLSHTPIISLTANALQEDRERSLQAGFDDHMAKPVEPEILLRTISTLIKATNMQDSLYAISS
jgi:signal transduction histidine kinase